MQKKAELKRNLCYSESCLIHVDSIAQSTLNLISTQSDNVLDI